MEGEEIMDQARANEVAFKIMKYYYPELAEQYNDKTGFELFKLKTGEASDVAKELIRNLLNSMEAVTPEGSDDKLGRDVFKAFLEIKMKELSNELMREMSFLDKMRMWWVCWKNGITSIEYEEAFYLYLLHLVDEVLAEGA